MTPGHIIHAIHFICTRRPRRPHSALTCCDRLPGRPAQFGSAGRGGNEAHASSPRMGWQRICIPVGPGKVLLSAPGRGGQLTREQGSVARAVGSGVAPTERDIWSGCYGRKAGGSQVLLGPRDILRVKRMPLELCFEE